MYPIDRELPGLSPWDQREARRIGREVAKRTGTTCFYHGIKGKLFWVYGQEPGGGPLGIEFKTEHGCKRFHAGEVDDMVAYINLGKMERRRKDRIAASDAAADESEKEQEQGRTLDRDRKSIEDYADFLGRKRRGTTTLVSA